MPPRPTPAQPNSAPAAPARVPLRPTGPVPVTARGAGTAIPAAAAAAAAAAAPAAAKPSEASSETSLPPLDPPLSLVEDEPLPSDLALEDTAALRKRGVGTTADPINGYNPYDTGPAAGTRPARDVPATAPNRTSAKRTDLRKLSQWIQTQRRVEDLKKDGDEGGK